MGVHLIGVHLTGIHLIACLIGVYLNAHGVHLGSRFYIVVRTYLRLLVVAGLV